MFQKFTSYLAAFVFALALIKLVLPAKAVRRVVDHALNEVATRWISGNSASTP